MNRKLFFKFFITFAKITRHMTLKILDVYKKCTTNFKYDLSLNPRRMLTDPSEGIKL